MAIIAQPRENVLAMDVGCWQMLLVSATELFVRFVFFLACFFDHPAIFDAFAGNGRMLFGGHGRCGH